jgi:hypothetical protein
MYLYGFLIRSISVHVDFGLRTDYYGLFLITMITEQDIQRAFFAHLQEFYRYRFEYIPGTFATESDALASGGIIADGVVTFTKPDGGRFLATFEATSADKPDEVKYKINPVYFLWDCLAFASMSTAVGLMVLWYFRFAALTKLGILGIIGMVLVAFLLTFSVWYFSMRQWHKYRYIYAIAQFKAYFADEQWVVLGYDVFPHSDDPYKLELRKQCTFHGFGLATVGLKGDVQIIATPSRLGLYGHDRNDANWLTGSTAYSQIRDKWERLPAPPTPLRAAWNKLVRPMQYLAMAPFQGLMRNLMGVQDSELNRFMQSYNYQKGITMLGCGLLCLSMWKVYQSPQFHTNDEYDALTGFHDRRKSPSYTNPEDEPGYVYQERLPITYGQGVPKQYPHMKLDRPEAPTSTSMSSVATTKADGIESGDPTSAVQEIDLSALRSEDETTDPKAPKIESPATYSNDVSVSGTTTAKSAKASVAPTKKWDWCTQIKGKSGWFVQDNYFVLEEGAQERMEALRAQKIPCFSVKATCLSGSSEKKGYFVFLKELFPTEESAETYLHTIVATMRKKKLDTGRTILRRN